MKTRTEKLQHIVDELGLEFDGETAALLLDEPPRFVEVGSDGDLGALYGHETLHDVAMSIARGVERPWAFDGFYDLDEDRPAARGARIMVVVYCQTEGQELGATGFHQTATYSQIEWPEDQQPRPRPQLEGREFRVCDKCAREITGLARVHEHQPEQAPDDGHESFGAAAGAGLLCGGDHCEVTGVGDLTPYPQRLRSN